MTIHSDSLSGPCPRQRGAAMLFAIAIIVVASLLGAAMVRMLRIEQESVAREVLSTRALLAADSAAQRALFQLFQGGITCDNLASNAAGFTGVNGLNNCTVTVGCARFDAGGSNTYFAINATGNCGPVGDQAVRRIEVLAQ